MPFDLPSSWWPPAPADATLLAYLAWQALRGATRGPVSTVSATLAFALALGVALAVGTAEMPLPYLADRGEARLAVVAALFAVLWMAAAWVLGLATAPLAVPALLIPGGAPLGWAAGALSGVGYGLVTAGLGLATADAHLPLPLLTAWLDDAPLARGLAAAGAQGLAVLATGMAFLASRWQERWTLVP